ncbi:MAG: competence/damage-inducible protein A, partial [Methylotenera sp.]|nr:competence/damage-inducible protein A [Methylotenera sp.]
MNHSIGIYIIGDEILSGKRQDAHLNFVIQALKS